MPRDRGTSEHTVRAADLRRRASRVRRLMGRMVSKADYDRFLQYVAELEGRAAELESADN